MQATRTLARLAALTARAIIMVARLVGLYFTLYLRLKAWRASNKLKFRVKVRSLPQSLARELAREYYDAVSQLRIPGPVELARLAFGRPRGRGRFVGGGGNG